MAPGKGSKNTKKVVPPKCLQDNIMHLDSETEMDSDNQSQMSQSLFKDTKTKVVTKKALISNKRTRAEKIPICIVKKNKHHRIEMHQIPDQDTEEPEQDAQMEEEEIIIEKVHPVYTIANKSANPPPPASGDNSQSDALAALGLTPIKTHKAQRSPTKSPKSTTGK